MVLLPQSFGPVRSSDGLAGDGDVSIRWLSADELARRF